MSKNGSIDLIVVGGGLAGSEAAWQAAERGINVILYEMRPGLQTGAHTGAWLAELVCSNSLGSNVSHRASGLLKQELRRMGSMLIDCAEQVRVPAGSALAVDRAAFAQLVTEKIENHERIHVLRQEMKSIPSIPAVIASGPLTSPDLSVALMELIGQDHLYFYDAVAPIIRLDSIDMKVAFRASRYNHGEQEIGDYINCPLTGEEYNSWIDELLHAERAKLKEYERQVECGIQAGASGFFEGCLPLEIQAERGRDVLSYGPMRPAGIIDPRTGRRPYAVVQLRQDNLAGTLYNLVGFQTNLKYSEQERIFRLIPGLEQAEFERFGHMHRNTFINSPGYLSPSLQFRGRDDLFFAGQITGVEGYLGNIATGLLAGWNAARLIQGQVPLTLPESTMLGGLCYYVSHASEADFQPMKANFGLLPELETGSARGKQERGKQYRDRALADLEKFLNSYSGNSHSHILFT